MEQELYIDVIIRLNKKLPKRLATTLTDNLECCYSVTKLTVHDNFKVTIERTEEAVPQLREQVKERFKDIRSYVTHFGVFSKIVNCYFN